MNISTYINKIKSPYWLYSSLAFLGLILIVASSSPLFLNALTDLPSSFVGGKSESYIDDWWDIWYYPEDKQIHQLRIRPEGLSVLIRDSEVYNKAISQLNIGKFKSAKDTSAKVHILSGMFCPPVDLDGDGIKEGIINVNDSTASYIISYDREGNFHELFCDEWPEPVDGEIWDANLFVPLAADFGDGLRLIITRITRFDPAPRKVIVFNPATKEVEAEWEMGAVPSGNSGLLSADSDGDNGFYIVSTITRNGNNFNGMNDSTAYLLLFTFSSTSWKMDESIRKQIKFGVKAIETTNNTGWLITDANSISLIDVRGQRISNIISGKKSNFVLLGVLDVNSDGYSDRVIICNRKSVLIFAINQDNTIEFVNEFSINDRISSSRCGIQDMPDRDDMEFAVILLSRKELFILDDKLENIGKIPFSTPLIPKEKRSSTYHGNRRHLFINMSSSFEGKVIQTGHNHLHIITFGSSG